MPKYINADELKRLIQFHNYIVNAGYAQNFGMLTVDILNTIDKMPAADVVEVVRCKDCKFFEPVSEYSGNCYRNEINNIFDGYCNKAERRETE